MIHHPEVGPGNTRGSLYFWFFCFERERAIRPVNPGSIYPLHMVLKVILEVLSWMEGRRSSGSPSPHNSLYENEGDVIRRNCRGGWKLIRAYSSLFEIKSQERPMSFFVSVNMGSPVPLLFPRPGVPAGWASVRISRRGPQGVRLVRSC